MKQIPKYEKPDRARLLKAIGLKRLSPDTRGVWRQVRCVDWRGDYIAKLDVTIVSQKETKEQWKHTPYTHQEGQHYWQARIFVTCPDCGQKLPFDQLKNHSQKHRVPLHELPTRMGRGYDDLIAKRMREAGQQTALNLFEEETHGTPR